MSSKPYTINAAGLERVRYFARQLINADDMLAEQQYFRQKLRRHNRFLHGWGVVCGMRVSAAPDTEKKTPWRVKIEPGYALGPYGDEIYLAEPYCIDLATCQDFVPDPCEPGEPPRPVPPRSGKLYVAIRYLECETRPVRIHPLGCACEDTLCEYSLTRDDFEVGCLPEPPKDVPPPLLCDLRGKKELAECPPCPESPWVVLAEVVLPKPTETEPDATKIELAVGAIDNFVSRRQLFRTEILQEQLIDCCCEPAPATNLRIKTRAAIQHSDILVYTISVTNDGLAGAQDVVVEDSPPDQDFATIREDFFRPDPGPWKHRKKPTLRAELGNLNPGESVQLSFGINVRPGHDYTNTATVTSKTAELNLADNTETMTTAIPD